MLPDLLTLFVLPTHSLVLPPRRNCIQYSKRVCYTVHNKRVYYSVYIRRDRVISDTMYE